MDKRKKWVWFDRFVQKKTKNQTSLIFLLTKKMEKNLSNFHKDIKRIVGLFGNKKNLVYCYHGKKKLKWRKYKEIC